MDNTYQKTTIGGYKVEVFTGYDGRQLFITDADGIQIYAHRITRDAMEIAHEVIARETTPAPAAAPAAKPVSSRRISLEDRQEEFWKAVMRGIDQAFVVFEDWDFGSYVVVNKTKNTEYRTSVETIGEKTWVKCSCKDFEFRKSICKHIAQTLQARMFGVNQAA